MICLSEHDYCSGISCRGRLFTKDWTFIHTFTPVESSLSTHIERLCYFATLDILSAGSGPIAIKRSCYTLETWPYLRGAEDEPVHTHPATVGLLQLVVGAADQHCYSLSTDSNVDVPGFWNLSY